MDIELKQKWVAALRSGEYEQGRCALKSGSSYCCLGVLCTVAGISNLHGLGFIPFGHSEAIGLSAEQENRLVEMNDMERAPFPVIADYIERNL